MSDPIQPLTPTPPYVLDAMDIIVQHLKGAGYVSVLVSETMGAIFYKDCPLKRQHALYAEIERLMKVGKELKRGK